jgi:hypothetical protein
MRAQAKMTTAKKAPNDWKELAAAFRESGRRFQYGRVSNNAELTRLLIVCSARRPAEGGLLQELLWAAESHAARGDRSSALEHFRAAIDLSLAMASRTGRPVVTKQKAQGMTGEELYDQFMKDVGVQFERVLPWADVPSRYKDAWNTIAEMTELHKKTE